ncbi:hypothetical protein PI124_g22078 [Phytophthora idaei]|nr:hypothetical protein PI125_g23883 [Phytophthora idaei]KAG3232846.1 hypothetical protein PI124_g22078 [Phytophthora idaei]
MQFELIHCSTEVLDAGNIKVEGSTSFPSAPARFYRYAIALKDSKLSIWMEDRKSKKQYKGDLDKKDYVTADNAITGASAEDYLQLLLKLRVLDSAWEAKFEFLLDPVSVERIDIVEAKLRDQEEELMKIDALESKLREQQEKLDILEVAETTSTSLAEFTSTLKFGENGKIRGVGHGSNEVVTNCYNGVLHIRRDGVYLIEAAVKCVGCATSDEDDKDDTDDTNEGDDDVDEIKWR